MTRKTGTYDTSGKRLLQGRTIKVEIFGQKCTAVIKNMMGREMILNVNVPEGSDLLERYGRSPFRIHHIIRHNEQIESAD